MATERTLAMIKPDAVSKNAIGGIIKMMEDGGLQVVAMKMRRFTQKQAEGFYAVHKARPFFADLCAFMSSGPIVALILEGEGAIAKYRELMGPTNSKEAPEGTIRGAYGTDIERNAVHGSDAPETAAVEMAYHFSEAELKGLLG
ncbi:MAG: nucleoside-diphosphate kinase [Proteobacteria bacterium]|nr:MAG: nucleoside-diphosphate kinase [Pseudomonadota bacterium]